MIYIVYSSVATYPLAETELEDILSRSRFNNSKNGITGLLLHHSGRFMQLIEGEEEHVQACYTKILQDSRHSDILKLVEKPLKYRHFQNWRMAFEQIDPMMPAEDGFSRFLSSSYSSMEFGPDINEGLFLLLSFKKQAMAQCRQRHRLVFSESVD